MSVKKQEAIEALKANMERQFELERAEFNRLLSQKDGLIETFKQGNDIMHDYARVALMAVGDAVHFLENKPYMTEDEKKLHTMLSKATAKAQIINNKIEKEDGEHGFTAPD